MSWTKEHFTAHRKHLRTKGFWMVELPDLDPILIVVAAQKSFEIVSSSPSRWPILQLRWQMLKDPNRNISVRKAQPFQQKSSRDADTHLIRSPRLQAVSNVLLHQGKPLTGRFIDVLALLNLLEYPLRYFQGQHLLFEETIVRYETAQGSVGSLLFPKYGSQPQPQFAEGE